MHRTSTTTAAFGVVMALLSGGCEDKTVYPDTVVTADAAVDGRPADAVADTTSTDGPSEYCEPVKISSGLVQGIRQDKSCAYLSIPYAKPPVGPLRWKRAQPPDPWTKVLVSDQIGKSCFQWTEEYGSFGEDCLTLRIWTPHPKPSNAPVLVWLNKGTGFSQGGIYPKLWANGTTLAETHGLVVVFVTWRLGPFGFLAHPALGSDSGNYGFFDQQDALKWVQDNIAVFGGDPSNVTLYGSGLNGAQSVAAHLVSKTSTGFHRAIVESGIPLQEWPHGQVGLLTRAQAEAQGQELAKIVGCDTAADVADCLRNKDAVEIRDAFTQFYQLCDPFPLPGKVQWGPIIDNTNLEGQPAALLAAGKVANKVPLIIGSSKDDTNLFFPKPPQIDEAARIEAIKKCNSDPATADAILKLYPIADYPVPAGTKATASAYALKDHMGDLFFRCPSRRTARHAAAAGMPVYLYHFTLDVSACDNDAYPCPPSTPEPFMGTSWICFHVLTFHMPQPDAMPDGVWMWDFSPKEEALSQTAMGYWARFAKTGDPNDPTGGAVKWPKYDETTDQYLELNDPPQAKSGLRKVKCDFWDTIHAP